MNAISWFAIPVEDLERARAFYCAIFDYDKMGDLVTPMGTCAIFPFSEEGEVGGSLNPFMGIKPSTEAGISVWLNCVEGVQAVLDRVETAGGKILEERAPIGENAEFGYIATLLDTEGNRVGLHAKN
ncbi:MAG: VOC family protein [Chromatiales bacterium]|nr:VOC family protein [Chromatiales bacterium]